MLGFSFFFEKGNFLQMLVNLLKDGVDVLMRTIHLHTVKRWMKDADVLAFFCKRLSKSIQLFIASF